MYTSLQNRYFTADNSSGAKTIADRIAAYITSSAGEVCVDTNIDDRK